MPRAAVSVSATASYTSSNGIDKQAEKKATFDYLLL